MIHHLLHILILLPVICHAAGACGYDKAPSQLCSGLNIDLNIFTCCNGRIRTGPKLACCGNSTYNVTKSSCCRGVITHGVSEIVSDCCESKAYNALNQLCCNNTVMDKTSPQSECCGSDVFNPNKHLCCNKKLTEKNKDSELCCCGKIYDNEIQYCSTDCTVVNSTYPVPSASTPPSSSYQQTASSHGSKTHENLNQQNSPKLKLGERCGSSFYFPWDNGALCCDGKLHLNSDGYFCNGQHAFSLHNHTVCQKNVHPYNGKHCCGNCTFNPETTICCDGQCHRKTHKRTTCCGTKAYTPNVDKKKCCAGHLHNLPGDDPRNAQCCGSVLLETNEEVCCHSSRASLVYKTKDNHSCCGHLYYNQSLYSCCSERLRHKQQSGSSLVQLRNLTDYSTNDICDNQGVLIGTVASVAMNQSHHFVVVTNVFEVLNNTLKSPGYHVNLGPFPNCMFPKLQSGNNYFWKKNDRNYEPISQIPCVSYALQTYLSLCTE